MAISSIVTRAVSTSAAVGESGMFVRTVLVVLLDDPLIRTCSDPFVPAEPEESQPASTSPIPTTRARKSEEYRFIM
jgi:hypothetical protein